MEQVHQAACGAALSSRKTNPGYGKDFAFQLLWPHQTFEEPDMRCANSIVIIYRISFTSMSSNSARFDLKNPPLQPFRRVYRYSKCVSSRAGTVPEVFTVKLFMILSARTFSRVESEFAMVNIAVLIPEYRQNGQKCTFSIQLISACSALTGKRIEV